MPAPTIAETLKVPAPAFIRKLGRASHWGQPDDSLPERVDLALRQVFRNQAEEEISIYLVSSDDDLRRIAIGMNAGRDSLSENVAFLAFSPAELASAGIGEPTRTPGNLKCDYANALHFDMIATDAQLQQLCTNLMTAGRQAARCTKGAMKEAEKLTIAEKCKSAPTIVECGVAACNAAVQQAASPS